MAPDRVTHTVKPAERTAARGRDPYEPGSAAHPREQSSSGSETVQTRSTSDGRGGAVYGSRGRERTRPPASSLQTTRQKVADLRHTTASLAIVAGADVKTLQTMLGHASAVMTLDRYGHLMPGSAEDVAARLDVLARAADPEPVRDALQLDARDFRGMEAVSTTHKRAEKRR